MKHMIGAGKFFLTSAHAGPKPLRQAQVQELWQHHDVVRKALVYIRDGRVYHDLHIEGNISGLYIKSAALGRIYRFRRG